MKKFEIVLIVLMAIIVILGLIIYGVVIKNNIEEILSKACEGEELTDWTRPDYLSYSVECNGVVKNKTCYIQSTPYCAEKNKWGDCIDWERSPKELSCK